jgi:hypothetical protein
MLFQVIQTEESRGNVIQGQGDAYFIMEHHCKKIAAASQPLKLMQLIMN